MNKRYQWLDVMKAFGIILVVINHMEGLHIPFLGFLGGMVYMPLFFIASGFTYRKKKRSYGSFLADKAKRLLIPYFICNFLLFAFFTLKNGFFSKAAFFGIFYSRTMLMHTESPNNMALMPYLNAPTWFLTCMFLCYAFYEFLERKFPDKKKRRIAVASASAAGILLKYISPVLLPWSIENALYFLILFESGRFLKEEGSEWIAENRWIYANFLMIFLLLSYMNGTVNVSVSQYGHSMVIYLAVSVLGTILVMGMARFIEKNMTAAAKILAWLGRHTLPVLCWHLFAIEIMKTVLRMAGLFS